MSPTILIRHDRGKSIVIKIYNLDQNEFDFELDRDLLKKSTH